MKLWRRKKDEPRPDVSEDIEDDKRSRKKENRARKEKDKEKGRQDSANQSWPPAFGSTVRTTA